MLLRKALAGDRVIEDDCLMGFVLWRDNPRVFIRMRGTTVSHKRFIVNRSIFIGCKHCKIPKSQCPC